MYYHEVIGLEDILFFSELACSNDVVSDISFSDAHSGDQEEIEGPRGDDHAVY